tara:strand:- start:123 stop:866 length:744 start_codon:yes stop_codon:yes gene_type:complete
MSLKTGVNLSTNYSINFSYPKRSKKKIKYVIIHYTGMKKEIDAIKKLCDETSKVSSHYFIKNNGDVLNLVPDLYKAWHAGKSNWKNLRSLNEYSLGIEIQNPGHENGYKKFSNRQILSLKKLLSFLLKKYDIKYQNVLGHSDIAPGRKKDPGEKFPWKKLAKNKLCFWHNLKDSQIKKYRKQYLNSYEEKFFLKNLNKIGYISTKSSSSFNGKKLLIKAFQRRFRQGLINGKSDKECYLISKNLLLR